MSREKKEVLECLESDSIADVVTTHLGEASVHVLPISRLNTEVTVVVMMIVECRGICELMKGSEPEWSNPQNVNLRVHTYSQNEMLRIIIFDDCALNFLQFPVLISPFWL